jgi:hypothetical protein
MKQQRINGLLLLFIPLILILIYSYFKRDEIKSQNKELEENGLYSVGIITKYNEEYINTNVLEPATVEFEYSIHGKYYESLCYNFPKNNIPKIRESYMIIYLPNEPKRSCLLCNYPVRDSSDYNRYIEEFKNNPPKLNH